MKILLYLFCWLLFSLSAFCQSAMVQAAFRAAAVPKATATSLPTPDIYTQDFEGGTLPVGWTVINGTPIWNYSPAILGSYSLNLVDTGNVYVAYSGASEVYVQLSVELMALPAAGYQIAVLKNIAGGAVQGYIFVTSLGKLDMYDVGFAHEKVTVAAMSAGTTYFLWIHYKAGTGSNALLTGAFSASNSEPTSGNYFVSIANSTSTGANGYMSFGQTAATGVASIIDHLGIATFAMPTGW